MSASNDGGRSATLHALGHLLKRLRAAADLTQEELAERAGLSVRLISDLERGSTHLPRRDTIGLLADGLRLRGFDRESFVALARSRPILATPHATADAAPRRTLPYPPAAIVGRLKETAATTAFLLDPEVRLLTLTGPGGVGKTRLALEAAFKAGSAHADGVVFVELAPLRDPELMISAIAQALDVLARPELPLRQSVMTRLQDKELLLVLDNFEHLPSAAVVVADLLAASPALTVLATSRTPLHIRAEREYAVGPLALPGQAVVMALDELARVPAVELFVRRAEAANSRFALTSANEREISEIVIRLDGLPLAIELAATRMKILSPSALLARMEPRLPLLTGGAYDLPIRQQAMRATLDWSHDLLSVEEQTLFRCLAVFAGGCTLDAAEWMAETKGATPARRDTPSVLDLLAGLVDKSLLRTQDDLGDDHRFRMLETIREYGLERLAAAGEEDEARRRHQTWCLTLAERAEPELIGADQLHWFTRLEIEHDNLRATLGWSIAQGHAETAMRLGGALYRFWGTRGHYEEGRRWLEQALALDAGEPSTARGNALLGAGVMVFFQGEYDRAASIWQEALTLFHHLGHSTGIAYSHGNLGLVADAQGDYDRATASYGQALALFRQLGDRAYIGYMLHNLGLIAYFQGDYARATSLFTECLTIMRERDDQNSVVMTLGNFGLVAFAQGDYGLALALNEESLSLGRQLSNRPWLARSIENFALIAAATGEPTRAVRLFGAAAALRAQLGASLPPNDREFNQRYIDEASARLGDDAFATAWDEGEAMSLDEAIAYALRYDPPRLLSTSRPA